MWRVRGAEGRDDILQLMLELGVEFPLQTGGMGMGTQNSKSFNMAEIECS